MEQNQRICSRCGRPAGDFHFCPSCLAPIDSLSALSTSEALRTERTLAAADGGAEPVAGSESTTVLQVESDRPSAEDATTQPNAAGGEGSDLQIHLGGSLSVPPPTPRDVARLEDVLSIGPKSIDGRDPAALGLELPIRVGPRVSVPPPAPREVARLKDVLTVAPEEATQIAPKTAAAAQEADTVAQAEAVVEAPPAAETSVAPVESVPPPAAPEQRPADRRYVPAYALRAAFWFEQASAFEAGSDDDEDEDLPLVAAAPVVESVPPPTVVTTSQPEITGTPVQAPRNHWLLTLCMLGLAALLVVLTGRRPCRCNCHGKSR